jgi:Phage capsid family
MGDTMSDVVMKLDDPHLMSRAPGEEFALAYARMADKASVTLRAAISDLFPLAQRRPRYTVRHLLRAAMVGEDGDVVTFLEAAGEVDSGTAAPEWGFRVAATQVPVGTVRAVVPVPDPVLRDPAALAAFVDFRLLVRLGTAENEALLNGDGTEGITGLLRTPGLRRAGPAGDVAHTLLAAAAECEWYGGSADGIVMHPGDWWPLLAEGAFLDRLAAAGVRISRTRMIPAGTVLVGDFSAAATLLDRRTSTLRMAVDGELPGAGPGLVAEIREGLAVHLPGHFVLARLPGADERGPGEPGVGERR